MQPDLTQEVPLVLVKDIPKLPIVPPRQGGGRMHQRTGFRWVYRGIRGVRLETVMIGGKRHTSIPALKRFFAAVSDAKSQRGRDDRVPAARRGKPAPADVEAELDRFGL